MDRLNLNYLRALHILLKEKHVTKAAQKLYLTQSAMSRQLAALRAHFDDPLLIRDGQGWLVTRRGTQLQAQVQQILQQIDQLHVEEAFDPGCCTRQFTFASTDYVARFIFPDVLARLGEQAPNIDINYITWQKQWLDELPQFEIDLASTMTEQMPDNLESIHLGCDRPVCLMSQAHPLRNKQSLTPGDICRYNHVQISSGGDKDSFVDQLLSQQSLRRRVAFRVPFFSAGLQVAIGSELLMVLPEHIARNASETLPLTYRPLSMELPKHNYYLFWHPLHQHDAAHQWFRSLLAEVLSKSMYSPGYDL